MAEAHIFDGVIDKRERRKLDGLLDLPLEPFPRPERRGRRKRPAEVDTSTAGENVGALMALMAAPGGPR